MSSNIRTISEQMKERMDSRPDVHTLAWWREQFAEVAKAYRGLTHAVNLVLAEEKDRNATLESMQEGLRAAQVAIGKLEEEIVAVKESLDKARTAYKNVSNQVEKLRGQE